MLKTIKIKKQMRLDDLIKYAFDNDVKDTSFNSSKGAVIYFDKQGGFTLGDIFSVKKASTFTVEIEEPITEYTVFKCLLEIIDGELVYIRNKKTIKESVKDDTDRFYALIDGKLELVWERDEE